MALGKKEYDAIVIGSGPNGLAAAITLQQQGLSVLLVEGKSTIGGGLRTEELTLPGFLHDVCSAIHPLAVSSPFFNALPLASHGLEFIHSPIAAAHPFDDGTSAYLKISVEETASSLIGDEKKYEDVMGKMVKDFPTLLPGLLAPLSFPKDPLTYAQFGMKAILPATSFANRYFHSKYAKGLFAGMAAHSMLPLSAPASAAFGIVLMAAGHSKGWPMAKGGSQSIANALASYFISLGGKTEVNTMITSLQQIPSSHVLILDTSPQQLLQIAGHRLSSFYKWQLNKFKYGMGVFKIDWALDDVIPFTDIHCREAATVHIGNTIEEIAQSESDVSKGINPEKPFVLLVQQSQFDKSRAPLGKQTAWAYCHVPGGSPEDRTNAIETQVERFAPGFRERILARHVMNSEEMFSYNPNYIGGNINGGNQNLSQLFTRPALRFSPYRTSAKGIYLCSASTPPGGGVHGMCGYYAAKKALKDIFRITI
ncbi:MAG: NAD(P)/FAD-dependent oxidoreductase [Bacteroidetes bacterium]|nr:NAD(P)/FAD-dependent oxidoreductase [Bacteroidota bacterium]